MSSCILRSRKGRRPSLEMQTLSADKPLIRNTRLDQPLLVTEETSVRSETSHEGYECDFWAEETNFEERPWIPFRQATLAILVVLIFTALFFFCQEIVRGIASSNSFSSQASFGLAFQIGVYFCRVLVSWISGYFNSRVSLCAVEYALITPVDFFFFIFYRILFENISSYSSFSVLQIEHVLMEMFSYAFLSLRSVLFFKLTMIAFFSRLGNKYDSLSSFSILRIWHIMNGFLSVKSDIYCFFSRFFIYFFIFVCIYFYLFFFISHSFLPEIYSCTEFFQPVFAPILQSSRKRKNQDPISRIKFLSLSLFRL